MPRQDVRVVVVGLAIVAFVAVCGACAWVAGPAIRVGVSGVHPGGIWTRVFLLSLGLAFSAYVGGLALLRRRPASTRSVAAIAVAIQLGLLGAPLLVSTDAWSYWDYARIAAVRGANPYSVPPAAFPDDAAYTHMAAAWHRTTSAYGPAFTLASEPIALMARSSATAAAWMFKVLGAVAVLAATALAGFLARRKVYAVAFVGWNPLLAVDFAGGGHNDAWMAALVLAALALAATGRRHLSAVAWAVASFVKWVPLLLLPLHLLEQRARGRSVRYLTLGASLLGAAAVASIAFGPHWLRAATPLARLARQGSHSAIPHRLSFGLPNGIALAAAATTMTAAYVWLLRSAAHGRARLGLAAGFILIASPYLVSWYTIWAVPLAAAEEDGAAQLLSLGLCAYLLRQGIRT
jgi:hypothetical protein